jgi:hypothetical protein
MTPNDIFSRVRMSPEIQDTAAVKYSDYQLMTALNSVLSIVYNTLSSSSNDLLTQSKELTLMDDVGSLPVDFLSVVNVLAADGTVLKPQSKSFEVDERTYRIRGNNIYSHNALLLLEYKPYFTEIVYDALDKELILPNFFSELLKKYSVISLVGGINKQDSTIVQQVTEDVYKLTSGREYSSIDVPPVWRV